MAHKNQDSTGFEKAQRIANPPVQRLYDLKQAAQYLGRPVWGVRELVWAGKLPVIKDDRKDARKQYLDLYDLDKYIEENKVRVI